MGSHSIKEELSWFGIPGANTETLKHGWNVVTESLRGFFLERTHSEPENRVHSEHGAYIFFLDFKKLQVVDGGGRGTDKADILGLSCFRHLNSSKRLAEEM